MQKLSYVLCKNQTREVEGVEGGGGGRGKSSIAPIGIARRMSLPIVTSRAVIPGSSKGFYAVDRENPCQNMYLVSEIGNIL